MRVKLLTFRYSATLGGFDDTALVEFVCDKEVIAFHEHFYVVNQVPHLSCIVQYQDAIVPEQAQQAAREQPRVEAPSAPGKRQRSGAPDPCAGLDEAERALFNHLREWRSALAHAEGIPPYVILTNKQLVAIVRRRPDSPTALGHIEGIGPGKLKHYGAAILERLHGAPADEPERSGEGESQPSPEAGSIQDDSMTAVPLGSMEKPA